MRDTSSLYPRIWITTCSVCGTGGKPSTWFPPGGLVEQSADEKQNDGDENEEKDEDEEDKDADEEDEEQDEDEDENEEDEDEEDKDEDEDEDEDDDDDNEEEEEVEEEDKLSQLKCILTWWVSSIPTRPPTTQVAPLVSLIELCLSHMFEK